MLNGKIMTTLWDRFHGASNLNLESMSLGIDKAHECFNLDQTFRVLVHSVIVQGGADVSGQNLHERPSLASSAAVWRCASGHEW